MGGNERRRLIAFLSFFPLNKVFQIGFADKDFFRMYATLTHMLIRQVLTHAKRGRRKLEREDQVFALFVVRASCERECAPFFALKKMQKEIVC